MSARASRWKRGISATMRWNHGCTRCARFANRPFADALQYSKFPRVSATPKVMTDGWVCTPSLAISASKRG